MDTGRSLIAAATLQHTVSSALAAGLTFVISSAAEGGEIELTPVAEGEAASRNMCNTITSMLGCVRGAVETVSIWRNRTSRLALSIESSCALSECILWDTVGMLVCRSSARSNLSAQSNLSARTAQELRAGYAMAILRGVNGLVDVGQQGGGGKKSVAVLATDIGIPSWVVDLRHDIAHNELPSLATLRMAASTLIAFFHDNYWDKKASLQRVNYENIMNKLFEYKRASKFLISGSSGGNSSENHKAVNVVARDFAKNTSLAISTEVVLAFFVEGNLGDREGGFGVSEDGGGGKAPTGSTFGVLCTFKESSPFEKLKRRYKALLVALQSARSSFTQNLLTALVHKLCTSEAKTGSEENLQLVVSWIRYLLSRDFLSLFDPNVGVMKQKNLREKSQQKWKVEERNWMAGYDRDKCCSMYSLNSLVDEYLEGIDGDRVEEVRNLFCEILGSRRVARTTTRKRKRSVEERSERELTLEELEAMCEKDCEENSDREGSGREEGEGDGEQVIFWEQEQECP